MHIPKKEDRDKTSLIYCTNIPKAEINVYIKNIRSLYFLYIRR